MSRQAPRRTIRDAFHEMIVAGCDLYGPRAVGIVLCGVPMLLLMTISYVVIGSTGAEVFSGASGLGVGAATLTKALGSVASRSPQTAVTTEVTSQASSASDTP